MQVRNKLSLRQKLLVTSITGMALFTGQPVLAETIPANIEAGITATYQNSNDNRVKDEALMSFDLLTSIPGGEGEWILYIEGNTSPRLDGVSSVFTESNADAASATDRDNRGRLQVSELHYSKDNFTVGLLDASAYLDASDVANDETTQFLAGSLVNNPGIEFPDYSLGLVYQQAATENFPGYTLLLSSSHGLADNDNKSYSELFDVSEKGKGIFTAAEFNWQLPSAMIRLGTWLNSSDHAKHDGTDSSANNYGVYAVADSELAGGNWNIRLGLANDEVSAAASFISLAAEYPFAGMTAGVGLSQTRLADKAATATQDDINQAEIYVRLPITANLELTPSIQTIENSGFDSSSSTFNNSSTIYSLRAGYNF